MYTRYITSEKKVETRSVQATLFLYSRAQDYTFTKVVPYKLEKSLRFIKCNDIFAK